jgi:hypothetical protein
MNHWLKAFFLTVVAQLLAFGAFITVLTVYNRTHPGQEAWPVIVPAVMLALLVESLVLFLSIRLRGCSRFFRFMLMVLLSWAVGMGCFLAASSWMPSLAPRLASLATLAILAMRVKRALDVDSSVQETEDRFQITFRRLS